MNNSPRPDARSGDVSAILELIDEGLIAPGEIVAILGKTEGNGWVNDFTCGYATMALSERRRRPVEVKAMNSPPGALPAARLHNPPSCGASDATYSRDAAVEGAAYEDPCRKRFVCVGPDGGGHGDPLAREPERVGDGFADGLLSPRAARRDYGVVLTAAGEVDAADTAPLCAEMSTP